MANDLTQAGRWEGASSDAVLDLMLPAELPAECPMSGAEADRIQAVLFEYLAALQNPHGRAGAIHALLATLDDHAQPVAVGATGIPAKPEEVTDFDRYFRVRRVGVANPAYSLLRGLLQTSGAVLSLIERAPALPQPAVDRQIAGFAAYARLLGRICGLDRLP